MSLMIEAIAKDLDWIIPCSTPLCSQIGYSSCAMGLPVRLGSGGVKEVIMPPLSDETKETLDKVARKIRDMIASAGY